MTSERNFYSWGITNFIGELRNQSRNLFWILGINWLPILEKLLDPFFGKLEERDFQRYQIILDDLILK